MVYGVTSSCTFLVTMFDSLNKKNANDNNNRKESFERSILTPFTSQFILKKRVLDVFILLCFCNFSTPLLCCHALSL